MKRSRIAAFSITGILLVATASVIATMRSGRLTRSDDETPLVRVLRGDLNLGVDATGELQASHVVMLSAPPVGGDALQITNLTDTGEHVRKGDVVLEFNPSEQQYKLEQSRSELQQAEQEVTKANADAAVLTAQDKVALLKSRYDVRKAELEVQKNELVSKITGEKNDLALDQAKRVLAETEKDVQSHADAGKASLYLAQEKYNKAKLAMDAAQQNLGKMKVTAPMDGLVSVQKNVNAAGGFFFTGMSLPDYKAGDQAQAGSAIVQILDPMELSLVSHVSERARSNVHTGQAVEVRFHAFPGLIFHGMVKNVSGMAAQPFFFEGTAAGNFDVSIQLNHAEARLRPGLTADVLFVGDKQKGMLYVPRLALFMKDGKHIVYVKKDSGYQQQEVRLQSENESRAAIQGVSEGSEVTLIDPTLPRKAVRSTGLPGGASGGSL